MTDATREQFLGQKIESMSLEQKVGQCFVLAFQGTLVTPNILHRIRDFYPAGIRVCFRFREKDARHDPGCTPPEFFHRMHRKPYGTIKDLVRDINPPYCTNEQYCEVLNTLKQAALANDLGHPAHITFDLEGDTNSDYPRDGARLFPGFQGIARSGDPQLAYEVALAICKQLVPIGFGWTHSLVLDVNTNAMNPEIGTRSFGEDPDTVVEYALAMLKGYQEGGIICTGKHFPGRGASVSDAHAGLPLIDLSEKEMMEHVRPYKPLIEAGMPAVMTAHTLYPSLEPEDVPATLSKRLLTDLLKGELGFEGCVTTDCLGMGGIVSRFELADACIRALNSGADLLLIRDEGAIIEEVLPAVIEAVRSGKLSEERVNDALRRSLGVKYDYGYFEPEPLNGVKDAAKAGEGVRDPYVADIALKSARESLELVRDEQQVLPLSPDTNVLLVEQAHPLHIFANNQYCHPPVLWAKMLARSENVGCVEVENARTEEDCDRVRARLDQADVIVITNYYGRRDPKNKGEDFVEELMATGKPVIVVTNSPFPFTVSPSYPTVIVTYGVSPESLDQAAALIYGELKAEDHGSAPRGAEAVVAAS